MSEREHAWSKPAQSALPRAHLSNSAAIETGRTARRREKRMDGSIVECLWPIEDVVGETAACPMATKSVTSREVLIRGRKLKAWIPRATCYKRGGSCAGGSLSADKRRCAPLIILPSIRCALNSDSNVFTGRCEDESNAPGDGGASRESQRCASASSAVSRSWALSWSKLATKLCGGLGVGLGLGLGLGSGSG